MHLFIQQEDVAGRSESKFKGTYCFPEAEQEEIPFMLVSMREYDICYLKKDEQKDKFEELGLMWPPPTMEVDNKKVTVIDEKLLQETLSERLFSL